MYVGYFHVGKIYLDRQFKNFKQISNLINLNEHDEKCVDFMSIYLYVTLVISFKSIMR